jgi:hypothetical protein
MLARRLALFFALLCAALASQIPEYGQQYRQRLGGAVDELNLIIARFDEDSRQAGLSEQQGIKRLLENNDEFIRGRGFQMQDIIRRRQKLGRAMDEPQGLERLFSLTFDFDASIARQAYSDYRPAVPVTSDGFIFGGIGFLSSFLLLRLLAFMLKRARGTKAFQASAAHRAFSWRKWTPVRVKKM